MAGAFQIEGTANTTAPRLNACKQWEGEIQENVVEAREWRADGTFWVMSFVFILVAMGAI